jgi:hypothetical protein
LLHKRKKRERRNSNPPTLSIDHVNREELTLIFKIVVRGRKNFNVKEMKKMKKSKKIVFQLL